jgi:hypothetical protein
MLLLFADLFSRASTSADVIGRGANSILEYASEVSTSAIRAKAAAAAAAATGVLSAFLAAFRFAGLSASEAESHLAMFANSGESPEVLAEIRRHFGYPPNTTFSTLNTGLLSPDTEQAEGGSWDTASGFIGAGTAGLAIASIIAASMTGQGSRNPLGFPAVREVLAYQPDLVAPALVRFELALANRGSRVTFSGGRDRPSVAAFVAALTDYARNPNGGEPPPHGAALVNISRLLEDSRRAAWTNHGSVDDIPSISKVSTSRLLTQCVPEARRLHASVPAIISQATPRQQKRISFSNLARRYVAP